MQDTDKPVDIDTSGPGAEVELDSAKEDLVEETVVEEKTPETDRTYENERETKLEDGGSADNASAKSDEPTDVQDKEKTEKKKELDEYSDGVKRRIAKLTKKMRESERREEAATIYAKSVLAEKEALSARLAKLDTGFVTEKESRIKAGMKQLLQNLQKLEKKVILKLRLLQVQKFQD